MCGDSSLLSERKEEGRCEGGRGGGGVCVHVAHLIFMRGGGRKKALEDMCSMMSEKRKGGNKHAMNSDSVQWGRLV